MSKVLNVVGGAPRILAPTTTAKVARRMVCAGQVIADRLPEIGGAGPALDILLSLYVAEDEAHYFMATELQPTGSASVAVTERWVALLVQQGLVDRRGDMLALSMHGHAAVTDLIEAVYLAQRALD